MKALELAESLAAPQTSFPTKDIWDAAAELRRLAEVNAELVGALADIRLAATAGYISYVVDRVDEVSAKAKEQQ